MKVRKRVPCVALLLLLCLVALPTAAQSAGDRLGKNPLAGAWRLVELDRPDADGQIHGVDCAGLFIFTSDGHLSVQVMERDPKPQSANGLEQYSQGGYEASYGSYTLDERTHTFTFHVEGALVRTLVGKDLPRSYELKGNRLTIKSIHPDEHWSVAWERY